MKEGDHVRVTRIAGEDKEPTLWYGKVRFVVGPVVGVRLFGHRDRLVTVDRRQSEPWRGLTVIVHG